MLYIILILVGIIIISLVIKKFSKENKGKIVSDFIKASIDKLPDAEKNDPVFIDELNEELKKLKEMPFNNLEASILMYHFERNQSSFNILVTALLNSELKLLSTETNIQKALFQKYDDGPHLCLFTDNYRANFTREKFPEFKFLLTVNFRDFIQTLKIPMGIEALRSRGARVVPSTPEEFARHIAASTKKWAVVVKASGAKID